MRRVAVTGLGVVSPVGVGCDVFFTSLLQARSGIRRVSAPLADRLSSSVAAEVDFDAEARFAKARLASLDRVSQFALVAAGEALAASGLELLPALRERMGVFVGSSMGGNQSFEAGYEDLFSRSKDRLPPMTVLRVMNNAAAANISIEHGLLGESVTYANACSSSAVSIGEAMRAIRHGYLDAAIAGGAESMLTYGTLRAWDALRTLARADESDVAASCRPFSRDRDGLVLGEGAAMVILEDMEIAQSRGAPILAELCGYGAASDATHLVQPSAEGQARAMRLALRDAGLASADIDYINAHGTATRAGDVAEATAIRDVFGTGPQCAAVSSTKSMHGHLMGAAGAIEFAASVLALRNGALPPTAFLREPDPECELNHVANAPRLNVKVRAVMSNSFAFGGSNAVLVARQWPA